MLKTEEMLENIEGYCDDPEPAAEEDIQMEYFSG
jgi:hypothetical protein